MSDNFNNNSNQIVSVEKRSVALSQKTSQWIQDSIDKNYISVPKGYNVGSEISTAIQKIVQTKDRSGKNALDVCTEASIMTSLRLMAINGLSMSSNQCYPIVYGNQLQIQRSYFGTVAQLKRMFPDKEVSANVIYEGDEYEYYYDEEIQCYRIKGLVSRIENRGNQIVAVFGTIRNRANNKTVYSEVMSWKEIQKSWSHAKTDNVQKEFPDQMAKRTLINRMCKMFINASNSVDPQTVEAYNDMTANEYDKSEPKETVASDKSKAIRQKSQGNAGLASILKAEDDAKDVEFKEVKEEPLKASEPQSEEITQEEVKSPTEVQESASDGLLDLGQEIPF